MSLRTACPPAMSACGPFQPRRTRQSRRPGANSRASADAAGRGARSAAARSHVAPGPWGLPEPDEDAHAGTSSVSTNLPAHGLRWAACAPECHEGWSARTRLGFLIAPASCTPPLAAGFESARGREEVPHVNLQSPRQLLQHHHRGAHAAVLDPTHRHEADPGSPGQLPDRVATPLPPVTEQDWHGRSVTTYDYSRQDLV